jgi:hypothetical protein
VRSILCSSHASMAHSALVNIILSKEQMAGTFNAMLNLHIRIFNTQQRLVKFDNRFLYLYYTETGRCTQYPWDAGQNSLQWLPTGRQFSIFSGLAFRCSAGRAGKVAETWSPTRVRQRCRSHIAAPRSG